MRGAVEARQARAPRTGRQGSGHRLRGRRHPIHGARRCSRRDLQHRAGLHRRDPRVPRAFGLRRCVAALRARAQPDRRRRPDGPQTPTSGRSSRRCTATASTASSARRGRRCRGACRRRAVDRVGSYYPPTLLVGAPAVVGDRAGRGLRACARRPPVRRRGRRHRARQRQHVRSGLVGMDARRRSRPAREPVTRRRRHVGQRPLAHRVRSTARRSQGHGFGKDMSIEPLLDYSVTRHLMIRHARPMEHGGFRPA